MPIGSAEDHTNDGPSSRDRYRLERAAHQRDLRSAVLSRDQGICVQCGSRDEIEAAHTIPVAALRRDIDAKWSHDPRLVVALCSPCHRIWDADTRLAPDLQPEMDRLMVERARLVDANADGWDQVSDLGEQMQSLFRITVERRGKIRTSIDTHLRQLYDIPSNEDPIGFLYSGVLWDFWEENAFWDIAYDDRHIAKKAGLSWSRGLRLWYGPLGSVTEEEIDKVGDRKSDLGKHLEAESERRRETGVRRVQGLVKRGGGDLDAIHARFATILQAMSTNDDLTAREVAAACDFEAVETRRLIAQNRYSLVRLGLAEALRGARAVSSSVTFLITDRGRDWLKQFSAKDRSPIARDDDNTRND
jgi:hypothetical protein